MTILFLMTLEPTVLVFTRDMSHCTKRHNMIYLQWKICMMEGGPEQSQLK